MSDEEENSENEDEAIEEGRLPKILKPFVQGGEEMLKTAKRVSNYSEGEACYGIVVGLPAIECANKIIKRHQDSLERMVWEAVGRHEEDQALKDLQRCVNPHEAELEIEDSMGRTPLFVSAAQNHREVCRMLLDNDVDVDKADKWGQTPLVEACKHGARECAILLIEADADVNSVTDTYLSPLMLAVRQGHDDVLRTLLHHDDIKVDTAGEYGHTALHIAAERGDIDMLAQLLRYKADVTKLDTYGNTALHLACKHGQREAAEMLIKYKCPLNEQNRQGLCALHFAVLRVSAPVAKEDGATDEEAREAHEEEVLALCDLLLDSDGIDTSVEAADTVGRTPLHLACGVVPAHEELIMALLDKVRVGLEIERVGMEGNKCNTKLL